MHTKTMIVLAMTLLLGACASSGQNTAGTNGSGSKVFPPAGTPVQQMDDADPNDPYYASVEPNDEPLHAIPTGSIFNVDAAQSLYVEQSHFRVGDIISVKLAESTKASKSGSTQLNKSTDFTLDPIAVPGGNLKIAGKDVNLDLSQQQKFKGDGNSSQSNDFEGEITVSIMKVLKNNNLLIRGDKWLLINNGKEFIRLTGVIRAKDILPDNTVPSTKIANARIEYSGNGELANSQRLGWLTDKLNNPTVWPF
ncbi:flagellar basal body L-ring protein FlgH [Shewanella yunxiaonensis]|uniref:Flagellar L-ring protein n=1 Tax=Shewanella yunxiaonensis TaxID=2829809 RepID=A0ABX7YUK0_9GAMM|nr:MULTISPECIES: flagellar basal body L-ring protein FlgH [Shewanella]MDF0534765.1 flagellar basal body L-ring protein FlgH [Shewanella sp. A32]QUN06310.1 flagellar basal body L-ring protein FlgH [Shewanella yunxiaonensis]